MYCKDTIARDASVHVSASLFPSPPSSVQPCPGLTGPGFAPQPMEIFVDDETKLTLHGLQQYYVKLKDNEKNRKLFDLLDVLEFNQVPSERRVCLTGRGL